MACSLTIFNSIFDNITDKRLEFDSFEKFEEALYKLSEKPLKEKKDAVLISPSTYIEGTTRANKNVMYWDGWCCVDVDDHKFEGDLKNELTNLYGDFHFVCYSTASSKHGLPKFRLVFPTTERIGGDDIRAFWFALNTQLNSLADKQTKDLSRMYYIPGSYAGAFNFIFTNTWNYIDPKELMKKYPKPEKTNLNSFMDRLPEEMQKQIIEDQKKKDLSTLDKLKLDVKEPITVMFIVLIMLLLAIPVLISPVSSLIGQFTKTLSSRKADLIDYKKNRRITTI